MTLSDAGEARIRGYLFMLESSLRTFVAPEMATDVAREIESHIRERARESSALPNERDELERLLREFGTPHRIGPAYSIELAGGKALPTGRRVAHGPAPSSVPREYVRGL